MKIERVKQESKFQPITISMTIESEEELDAILEMTDYEISIPSVVDDDPNGKQHKIVKSFLQSMRPLLVIGGQHAT